MTYNTDPSRWTESLAEAPDALRAPFAAARNEGPSDLQVRALALKLAALSAGTAVAASAATAKAAASTTAGGAAAASAGTISVAKIAISVALFGATVTGAVVWQGKGAMRQVAQEAAPAAQVAPAPQAQQPGETRAQAHNGALSNRSASPALTQAPAVEATSPALDVRAGEENSAEEAPVANNEKLGVTSPADEGAALPRTSSSNGVRGSRARSSAQVTSAAASKAGNGEATRSELSARAPEVDLLRRARAALTSRPREAFAITQEHRTLYPNGVFAQERDALAIEALMRAGEMDTARTLAERFVREHPSSPHAHRFIETMNLR